MTRPVTMRPDPVRRALADRVAKRVAGSGISRHTVEETVDRVVSALGAHAPTAGQAMPAIPPAIQPTIVAALMSRSAPDLGSRVRAALQSAGAAVLDLGVASAGRHTVVTVHVPAGARAVLDTIAASLQLALTLVPDDPSTA